MMYGGKQRDRRVPNTHVVCSLQHQAKKPSTDALAAVSILDLQIRDVQTVAVSHAPDVTDFDAIEPRFGVEILFVS